MLQESFLTRQKHVYRFVILLVSTYVFLYTINYLLTGLLQPGGYYNEWLATHFDYVTAFRDFLLGATAKVVELMNYETYLTENLLYVKGGQNIRMVYSCMGINILCLWWAFVIAFPMEIKKKVLHFFFGTSCLVALNIARLSMLTMSPDDYSFGALIVDHHTMYNWVAYGVILLAMKCIIDKKTITK